MDEMRFEQPTSVTAAVKLLAGAQGLAKVLAGGTDLLVQMRGDAVTPALLVDIKKIPETRQIKKEKGGFRIGAAVSGAELGEHPEVSKMWPGVVEAVELIGSTQVQGRATMAGNLCNASPGGETCPGFLFCRSKRGAVRFDSQSLVYRSRSWMPGSSPGITAPR